MDKLINRHWLRWLLVPLLLFTAINIQAADKEEFNHLSTGFALDGAHEKTECQSCHIRGVFKGTPKNCSGCHDTSSVIATSKKSTDHIQTSGKCADCHTDNNWTTARMDHSAITASCSTCHNGTTATGKTSSHVASSNGCDNCHTSKAWTPARFDHSTVTATCIT